MHYNLNTILSIASKFLLCINLVSFSICLLVKRKKKGEKNDLLRYNFTFLQNQDKSSLLMFHRHTSIDLDREQIVVLGGGGNCFSFGTHLNRTPVILNVGPCIDAIEQL